MTDLTERLRRIIDHHTVRTRDDSVVACSCGAEGVSDHPRHVAEQIVGQLRLNPEQVSKVGNQIRYVSALFGPTMNWLASLPVRVRVGSLNARCQFRGAVRAD